MRTIKFKRSIQVRCSFAAMHQWNDAPEEVKFLRNLHRHIFNVVATIPVNHDDRELEYFMVQRKVEKFIDQEVLSVWDYSTSCEMIAERICSFIVAEYDRFNVTVEVNEDGENGSIVEIYE